MNGEEFHLLPCKIDHNGEAKVSKYMIIEEQDDKTSFKTTLRGRGLHGCDFGKELEKKNFQAISLKRAHDSADWKQDQKALKMTVWQHDQKPSYLNSPVMNAPGWIDLANAIHQDQD